MLPEPLSELVCLHTSCWLRVKNWTGLFERREYVGMVVVGMEPPTPLPSLPYHHHHHRKGEPGRQNPQLRNRKYIRVRQYDFTEINSLSVLPHPKPCFPLVLPPPPLDCRGRGWCKTIRVHLVLIHFSYTLTKSDTKKFHEQILENNCKQRCAIHLWFYQWEIK